jgi:hemoglobin
MPAMSQAERRQAAMAEVTRRVGVDEAMIQRLVETFYADIRADPLLGPIFHARVADWDAHLSRMRAFWSSVALGSAAYSGTPMEKHLPLQVDARHFDHWLTLFRATARATCPPLAADHFIERAERIAASLEIGVATHLGAPPAGRLRRPDAEVYLPSA